MELLPCPFCGGNNLEDHLEGLYSLCISCNDCSLLCVKEKWNTRHSPWISVKYKLPENGTNVLSCSKGGGISTCIFMTNDESAIFILMPSVESVKDNSLVVRLTNVTHWMPLIQPPKETE